MRTNGFNIFCLKVVICLLSAISCPFHVVAIGYNTCVPYHACVRIKWTALCKRDYLISFTGYGSSHWKHLRQILWDAWMLTRNTATCEVDVVEWIYSCSAILKINRKYLINLVSQRYAFFLVFVFPIGLQHLVVRNVYSRVPLSDRLIVQ